MHHASSFIPMLRPCITSFIPLLRNKHPSISCTHGYWHPFKNPCTHTDKHLSTSCTSAEGHPSTLWASTDRQSIHSLHLLRVVLHIWALHFTEIHSFNVHRLTGIHTFSGRDIYPYHAHQLANIHPFPALAGEVSIHFGHTVLLATIRSLYADLHVWHPYILWEGHPSISPTSTDRHPSTPCTV